MKLTQTGLKRRDFVVAMGSASLVSSVAIFTPGRADANAADAQKLLAAFTNGVTPTAGRVKIGAPEIAENGNTVPITIDVESPMTDANYVKSIILVADGNPLPGVARFELTPANGQAHVEFRIRLAQTQNITAVAQLSDGSLWSATRAVKVTIGGCGG